MSDELVKRLDNVWAMLEEEGYYVKADTVVLAKNRIEDLEAKLEKAGEERDEALNQLDSARHSVEVLENRLAELTGESHE